MKRRLITLASLGLAACVWAADQTTAPTWTGLPPPSAVPSLQLPLLGPEPWLTDSWSSQNAEPLLPPGSLGLPLWSFGGQRQPRRSEPLINQHLDDARARYLARDDDQAIADLLKAALLLQEEGRLATATVQVELSGSAIALEHEAESIAAGHGDPMSRLNGIFRQVRRAARDFDLAHFGGV